MGTGNAKAWRGFQSHGLIARPVCTFGRDAMCACMHVWMDTMRDFRQIDGGRKSGEKNTGLLCICLHLTRRTVGKQEGKTVLDMRDAACLSRCVCRLEMCVIRRA